MIVPLHSALSVDNGFLPRRFLTAATDTPTALPATASDVFASPNALFNNESEILIYDLLGNVFYHENVKLSIGVDKVVDLKSFSSAVYYIQIKTGNEVFTEKVFVIR